ncbi:MAG: hypothetical protein ACREL3_08170 [Gemmatimonadales bacterium]
MHSVIVTIVIAAARLTGPSPACEILSTTEVARFLRTPAVRIDSINSGMNEMTKVDVCSWYVREGESEGVMLKLRHGDSPDGGVAMLAARVDEGFPAPAEPVSVAGVGDEAQYLPYPDGRGGTIIVRKGADVATLIGSAPKETLVSMAKVVVSRF